MAGSAFWDDWYTSARGAVSKTVQSAENAVGGLFRGPETANVDPNEVYTNPVTGKTTPIQVVTTYGENAPVLFQGVEVQNVGTGESNETYGPSVASQATEAVKASFTKVVNALPTVGAFLQSTLIKTVLILLVVVLAGIFVYGYARSR